MEQPQGKSATINSAAQNTGEKPQPQPLEKKPRDEHGQLPAQAPKLRPPSRTIPKNVLHLEQKNGYLEISSAVIATIVQEEMKGIEEVAAFDAKTRGVSGWFGKGQATPGLELHIDGNSLSIDMTIAMRYGKNIPAVADTIRRVLAEKINHMTGCTLSAVNIIVDRIEHNKETDGETHGQASF